MIAGVQRCSYWKLLLLGCISIISE